MSRPDGAHTHGGGGITAGGAGVLILAGVAYSERHQIGQAVSEAVMVALAIVVVFVVLGVAALVLLIRHNRRQAEIFAVRRAEQVATYKAEMLERQQARAALPAAQAPQIISNHYHLDAASLAMLLRVQQSAPSIPAATQKAAVTR